MVPGAEEPVPCTAGRQGGQGVSEVCDAVLPCSSALSQSLRVLQLLLLDLDVSRTQLISEGEKQLKIYPRR